MIAAQLPMRCVAEGIRLTFPSKRAARRISDWKREPEYRPTGGEAKLGYESKIYGVVQLTARGR